MQGQDDAQQALPVKDARRERPVSCRAYRQDEVVSALQKSIRRGLEDDALYWAVELDESGWGEYCWSRLFVITSEDVGLAESQMPAVIRALYESWIALRKRRKGPPRSSATSHGAERLPLAHAVLLLARARKSQLVVDALIWHGHLAESAIRAKEVPEIALDKHTLAGKKRGRGWAHFF